MAEYTEAKKKRKPNWTQEETLRLVNVLNDKRLVINGKFKPTLTHKDKKEAWLEITNIINGTNPLIQRTIEEVETKWFSVLSKSRRKVAAQKNEYTQTGENSFIFPFEILRSLTYIHSIGNLIQEQGLTLLIFTTNYKLA